MSEKNKGTKRPWWKPSIGVTIFLMLFGLWWGVPTFLKWRADVQVKELCAKDGGVKVYETVILPPEKFDKWGNPNFIRFSKGEDAFGSEYLFKQEVRHYKTGYIKLWRDHIRLFRRLDGKLLGEAVSYSRVGGDPIGPWEPSHIGCPTRLNFEKLIFKRKE